MMRAAFALMITMTIGTSSAVAQSAAKLTKIGVLLPGTPASAQVLFQAFEHGMRELGYQEGEHVVFERRFAEGRPDRLPDLAAELVRLSVDVIVTSTDPGIAAVKQQTRTIPIVMANSTDPVGTGFVASLARPGGNITGNSSMSAELTGKRLDLLREVVPGLSRVAILWNPDIRGAGLEYRETEGAAGRLHLQLQSVEVTRNDDLDRAFAAMATGRAQALLVPALNPMAFVNRNRIAALARQHRLPSIYGTREFADVGGLMAFGANVADQWRRAAAYVDRILKGARPGDLPVQQPTTFELVVNLKTAKALGLTIPSSLLQRADHVVR